MMTPAPSLHHALLIFEVLINILQAVSLRKFLWTVPVKIVDVSTLPAYWSSHPATLNSWKLSPW
jgi:hypothetical protein